MKHVDYMLGMSVSKVDYEKYVKSPVPKNATTSENNQIENSTEKILETNAINLRKN